MLSNIFSPRLKADVTWSAYDPRWYQSIGGATAGSGPAIVPDDAMAIATVYRAVNVLAHAVASVPLVVYEQSGDDKQRARNHPAYDLLHDQPNSFMTSWRWRHLLMTQSILWGNHYSEIIPGVGGVGSLVPLSPETTRVVDQMRDGRLVYITQDKGRDGYGAERRLIQDEVLHIRGFSTDGKSGVPITTMARTAMGLALSAEKHGSMFMAKGARLSGVLTTPVPMKEDVRKENEAAWQRQYGGANNAGGTPVLTGGLEYKPISSNNKDSQWLESREFSVQELLRFIGVPGVLVGHADKTATFASAEQFFQSFVDHSVMPWTENITAELNTSVIVGAPKNFCGFILDGLKKGDIKTRYDSYSTAIMSGFMNRNEARAKENLNRGGEELDTFLQPLNMAAAGAAPEPEPEPVEQVEQPNEPDPRVARLVRSASERLARKESAAVEGSGKKLGAAKRFADNPEKWGEWLAKFYGGLAEEVADSLGVTEQAALAYCMAQRARLGHGVPDGFQESSVASLMVTADAAEVANATKPKTDHTNHLGATDHEHI